MIFSAAAAAAAAAAHDRTVHVSHQEKPETFFLNTCAGTGGSPGRLDEVQPWPCFFHIHFTVWSGPGAVERQTWGPFARTPPPAPFSSGLGQGSLRNCCYCNKIKGHLHRQLVWFQKNFWGFYNSGPLNTYYCWTYCISFKS